MASQLLGLSVLVDEKLAQLVRNEAVKGSLDQLTLAAKLQHASGRGMGSLIEFFDSNAGLILRLPVVSGREAARNLLGEGRFVEEFFHQMWCCERQALRVGARLMDGWPVSSIAIYATKEPCHVCNRRLQDAAIVQRWKIQYYWPGQPRSYSPSDQPRTYRPARVNGG
jgi:hypothetical protein